MSYFDVLIIGGGCAGLTAAIYCARANLRVGVLAGSLDEKGGLLSKTSLVENFPGFADGILGYDLVTNMEQQAVNQGAIIMNFTVVQVDVACNRLLVNGDEPDDMSTVTFYYKSLIIATGSKPVTLKLDRESDFWGRGVSSCAVCDGALYRNKNIVVVGGGDTAMEEALFLTKFSNVLLIHRRDSFRASRIMQKRVLSHPKIKILYNSVVLRLLDANDLDGENRNTKGTPQKLAGIQVKNLVTGIDSVHRVDGLFYGLGLVPNTQLFRNIVEMNDAGYITVRNQTPLTRQTSVDNIFVAGDAHDEIYRQAVVAAGDGCKAAIDATNFLKELE